MTKVVCFSSQKLIQPTFSEYLKGCLKAQGCNDPQIVVFSPIGEDNSICVKRKEIIEFLFSMIKLRSLMDDVIMVLILVPDMTHDECSLLENYLGDKNISKDFKKRFMYLNPSETVKKLTESVCWSQIFVPDIFIEHEKSEEIITTPQVDEISKDDVNAFLDEISSKVPLKVLSTSPDVIKPTSGLPLISAKDTQSIQNGIAAITSSLMKKTNSLDDQHPRMEIKKRQRYCSNERKTKRPKQDDPFIGKDYIPLEKPKKPPVLESDLEATYQQNVWLDPMTQIHMYWYSGMWKNGIKHTIHSPKFIKVFDNRVYVPYGTIIKKRETNFSHENTIIVWINKSPIMRYSVREKILWI